MVDSMGFLDLKLKIGKSTCWLLYSEALVDFSLLFVVKNLVHVDGVSLKVDPILRDSEAAKGMIIWPFFSYYDHIYYSYLMLMF
ncbi:unnamed protein product [Brassica rapa]|uniref:Uncharacterized protein n=2 Tax=Brassica campestris TaxID=3711 RepID=A0A8D9HFG0_BRACM|nr:unnamed protein product [Brassica rapa]